MCDVFQLLKYFDNFHNFTSHLIKSFPENINFANTISNCLMPEECTLFQTNWKVRFTPLDQRSWSHLDMDRLGATHSFGTTCTYWVSDSLDKQPSFVHSTTTNHMGLLHHSTMGSMMEIFLRLVN